MVRALPAMVDGKSGVAAVGEILTVHDSPHQIIAMLSVDFVDDIPAREVERLVCEIEEQAGEQFPEIHRLYIRPNSPVDREPPE
jgi:hypothetical protein